MGGIIDEVFLYPTALSQSEMDDLYQSIVNQSAPQTGTRKQKGHKFQRPYKAVGGGVDDIKSLNSDADVVQGGSVDWTTQIDCSGNNCDSFGPRVYRSIDGGATYAQINDTCGVICFLGDSNDPHIVTAPTTGCLTGALDAVDGVTNFTSAAVPSVTLPEDSCTTIRYKFRIAPDATIGQEIYLKVKDQNGNEFEDSAEPTALGAKLTVIGPGGSAP
jgi:hypothetical protein